MSSKLAQTQYSYNKETLVWIRHEYVGIAYSDGDEVERRIASIIDNATDLGVLSDELRPHYTDWPSLYHLSSTRANILRPFESELRGDTLEIGAGCGAITRFLGECGGNVLALEGSPRRAAIARARTRDLDNVTVVCDKFEDFSCGQKFDVVTLVGVLEYANLFTAGENPTLAMLKRVRNFLKPSGKLIIAIENQLGLKYFAGAPEDHIGISMYGIEARYRNDQPQTFGRKELASLIGQAGFLSTEYLVPFPDYKLPVSIITAHGFSCDEFDAAALAWQSVRRDPQLPPTLVFSPELVWPTIVNNGLALDLANSFLIVASQVENESLVSSNTLAWHFSSDRLAQYAKEAQFIRNDVDEIDVLYRRLSTEIAACSGRKLFNFNLPKAESYKHGVPLLQKAVLIVTKDGWHPDDIGKFLLEYIKILCDLLELNFREVNASISSRLPGAVFDLTPQNIIVLNRGGYATIDHEWTLLEPIELGYLLFRSLIALLNAVTKFGRPRGDWKLTRKEFVFQSLTAVGFHLCEKDIERYLQREGELRSAILGADRSNYLEWEAGKSLPILRESEALQAQLAATVAAKANAEELAHGHLAKLEALQAQMAATVATKANAEQLAYGYLAKLDALHAQLATTEAAKANAEKLAHDHLANLDALQAQLEATEAAKANAEDLAHGHLAKLEALHAQLVATEAAKANAEELAHDYLAKLEALQAQLAATVAIKANAEQLAYGYLAKLDALHAQLATTEAAKANAEELAHDHLANLGALQAQLAATEAAKANAEELAFDRLDKLNMLCGKLESITQILLTTKDALNRSNERIARIQDSKGYKLMATLRLAPNKDIADV